jgi:hypothetical protein
MTEIEDLKREASLYRDEALMHLQKCKELRKELEVFLSLCGMIKGIFVGIFICILVLLTMKWVLY